MNGYQDFTSITATANAGNSYSMYTNLHYTSSNNLYIWIDFNDDGDFFDAGELISSTNGAGINVNTNISIASNAIGGIHRMRVRNSYSTQTNFDQPCGEIPHGETEDYQINIIPITGLTVNNIIHDDYVNEATANDSVGIQISSYYAFNISDYSLNMSIERPDGSALNYTISYTDTILGGATVMKYFHNIDFTQGGQYEITAVTTTPSMSNVNNYPRTETFDQAPFATPYSESFSRHTNWWNSGINFANYGWRYYQNFTSNTFDSLITPSFEVSNNEFLFYYNANSSYLSVGDTVLVQIAELGQAYSTVDTLYYGYYGYDEPINLAAYSGKRIRVQFRVNKGSSTFSTTRFEINEIRIDAYTYDFSVTNMQFPNNQTCGSYEYPIKVQIHNLGNVPQSVYDVSVRVYGSLDTLITVSFNEAFDRYETKWIDVGTIAATQGGQYEIDAEVTAAIDNNVSNNKQTQYINISNPTPLVLDIQNSFTNYNWISDNFNINSNYIYSSFTGRGDTSSVTTYFRIGNITPEAEFHFEYNIWCKDDNNAWMNYLGYNDSINVYIANDIYGTYTKIATIDSTMCNNTSDYQSFDGYDLSSYLNQNIVVKFEVINGLGNDTSKGIEFQIDNFYIGKPMNDVALNNIYSSIDAWCGDNANEFFVTYSNNSRFAAYNVPITFELQASDGSEYKYIQYIDTIPKYTSNISVKLDTVFNMTDDGSYTYTAYITDVDDSNNGNNSQNGSLTIYDKMALPYLEDFSNNPFAYKWSNINFSSNGNILHTPQLSNGGYAELISPKFGEITSGSYLAFKYNIYSGIGNYLRDGDSVKVFISNDCGDNWNEVYNLNHTNVGNNPQWQYIPNIDLTSYQGQSLRVKISFNKLNPSGSTEFQIDDFNIVSSGDAGVTSVQFPNRDWQDYICGNANEDAMVIVHNYGIGSLNNVPVKLAIAVGQDTTFFTANTAMIAAGSVDTVYISGLNTSLPNNYKVAVRTELNDDLNPNNDGTAFQTLSTFATQTMPYFYYGNNTPGNWNYFTSEANNGSWNSNGSYLVSPLLDNGDTAYFQTSKIGLIQANDELNIKFNVSSYTQSGSYFNNEFRANDEFQVQISNDCGASYTTVATFNSNNYIPSANGDTAFVYELANYIGDEIAIRLWTEKNSTIGKLKVSFDNISFAPAPTPSISLMSIYTEDEICGKADENIYAVVYNNSNVDVTNFNIVSNVKSNNTNLYIDTLSFNYSGTLAIGEYDTITIGGIDSQSPDTYIIESEIFIDNNSFGVYNTSFIIWNMHANNYVAINNNYQDWKYDGAMLAANQSSIISGSLNLNRSSYAFSPKVENIAPGSILKLNYSLTSGSFGMDDQVNIYASNDCGATYSLINTFSNSNNLSSLPYTNEEVSLAAFAGQDVQFKVEFSNGNYSTYNMSISNVKIVTTDIEALGIVTETADFILASYNPNNAMFNYANRYVTCGDADHNLIVVVKNTGETQVDTINVTIAYSGKATGTLSGTYIGALQPNQSAAVNISGTIDTETPGLIDMTATVTTNNDALSTNNTIGYSITTQDVYSTPYSALSGNHFNEQYYWKYDNNGNMSRSGSSFYANNLTQGDTAFTISPKIEITNANSHLLFNYTVSNSINGHIINNETAQVLVSSDCGTSWTNVWNLDVNNTDFGSSSMVIIDLSTYVGQNVIMKFQGIKGNSNGLFSVNYNNIEIIESSPAEITVAYNGENHTSGAVFCENNNVNFSTIYHSYLSYEWILENTDTTFTIGTGYSINRALTLADSGKVILEVRSSTQNNLLMTAEYNINVCETPVIVLNFNNEEQASGSTFAVGDIVDFSFNSNTMLALNYNWSIDVDGVVSSIGTAATLSYTLSNTDNGTVSIELINPVSNYVIATATYIINTIDIPTIVLKTANTSHPSGATFCEGTEVKLSHDITSSLIPFNVSYLWKINGQTIGSGSNLVYDLTADDDGTITLEVTSSMNELITTASYSVTVNPLPTKPAITGHTEVVSNVDLSEYVATSSFADQYLWEISAGGQIYGQTSTGYVDWTDGFVGHTMISVSGYNACGLGESSNDFLVYVDYLDPTASDYNGDESKNKPIVNNGDFVINTFPNPNKGNFSLELPEGVESFNMEIRNNQGLLLQTMDVDGSSTKIDLGHQVPGVYHVRILSNGDVHTKTFIIY